MPAARNQSETFSSVDAAWLHMDTPTNLAMITGVISMEGQIDYQRLQATIERRLLIHRRFRQRVREPNRPFGLPRWETDRRFDLKAHLKRATLPEPGDHAALQQLVSDLMSQPLDPARPLWQFHIVNNYQNGSALICRLHHCIADGLALMQVLLSIADSEPDAPWPEPIQDEEHELGLLARILKPAVKAALTVGDTWRVAGALVHEGMDVLVNPSRLLDVARLGASGSLALGKLLLIGPDRKTILRGQCDIPKRAAWSNVIPVEQVKSIGRLMGGTINDVLLAAMTGALRRYLVSYGEPVEGLNIRAIIPVNLRPPEELNMMGNRFGLVFLSLPVGIEDPLKRLVVLRRRMDAIKDSPEAVVALGILGAVGMSPTQIENIILTIFGKKGTAVVTNVPGPRQHLYLAGQKITGLMFWVPTPANLGVGISIISYAGEIVLGVATDEGLVPDPESVLQMFHDELQQMQRWGRPAGKTTSHVPSDKSKQPQARPITPEETLGRKDTSEGTARCEALTKAGRRCKNRAAPGSTTCHVHRKAA